MSLDTTKIIAATEKLYTLTKRAAVSDCRDVRRDEVLGRFRLLATDLSKLVDAIGRPDWETAHEAVVNLHTAACVAEERRLAPFTHLGSETAVLTNLHALAAILGFALSDAATARVDPDDIDAMTAVEGVEVMRAAE